MNNLLTKTLSEIVTDNYSAAPVLEKYRLDFCCKGKRALQIACEEKNISVDALLEELKEATALRTAVAFNDMTLTDLVNHIVRVHHTYVKFNMPQIEIYIDRVASKHGDRYPYMIKTAQLFNQLQMEMTQHMQKEEKVIFPIIKNLDSGIANYVHLSEVPLSELENEHEAAGSIMAQIRLLTDTYSAPEAACTTFKLCLASLQAFETDLHQHVHLENNILFPKFQEKYFAKEAV